MGGALLLAAPVSAQDVDIPVVETLKGILPAPADTGDIIIDKVAAAQLGKALFWDTSVGSDGNACASCHFHAGGDIRIKNQINPATNSVTPDLFFSKRASSADKTGPNKELAAADFPFRQQQNTLDRESPLVYETNDRMSSQGAFAGGFVSTPRSLKSTIVELLLLLVKNAGFTLSAKAISANALCTQDYTPVVGAGDPVTQNPFHANNLIYRKVEPRQAPTMINSVFNQRQFWDGRANNLFNGVDPFGMRTNLKDPSAGILVASGSILTAGLPVLQQIALKNSSLASQAVGPPLSNFEMSCSNRTFADLGRSVLSRKPLANQHVHAADSLFAKTKSLIAANGIGLNTTYTALVKKAFNPKYWANLSYVTINDNGTVKKDTKGYLQIEQNFSMFFGLAIQEYEALLISDDSPFDRGPAAMSAEALAGQDVFMGQGKCVDCHNGPLFSAAAHNTNRPVDNPENVERMLMGDGTFAVYDNGFYNIGVNPTNQDLGVGGLDPYGFDLSFTRQYKWRLLGQANKAPDRFEVNPCFFEVPFSATDCTFEPKGGTPATSPRDAVDGAFKVPILRNVGLNPPYMHNGGKATLQQVVRFYNRGGDRRGPLAADTTGFGPTPFGQTNPTNLDPDIGDRSNVSINNGLGLSEDQEKALVAFLLSLSDDRVACHAGPFDHPELPLSFGHADQAKDKTKRAKEILANLPAVGDKGLPGIGKPCMPNSGDLFGDTQDKFKQILGPQRIQ